MTHEEALDLIRDGVPPGGTWADLGAGSGTFTRALAQLLGPGSTIHAIDRSVDAVRALERMDVAAGVSMRCNQADFAERLNLPALDGILMANALHFVADQAAVLRRIVRHLKPGGSFLLVEYQRERSNRWVPHPVPFRRFEELAAAAGLTEPREVGRRRSVYWREMYAAVARREPGPAGAA